MTRKSYPTDLTDAQWQAIFIQKAGIFVAKKAFETYPSLKDFEQTNLSAENFVKLGYISKILKFIK
ncbi:transposase [Faucicola mancuniensis]|uniref:transposase n=1 Tax=Faucicola mancuniensis TaxID=1309795 RepID=UPI00397790BC